MYARRAGRLLRCRAQGMRPTGRHTASIRGVVPRTRSGPDDGVGEQKPLGGAVERGAGQRGGMTMDKAWAAGPKV